MVRGGGGDLSLRWGGFGEDATVSLLNETRGCLAGGGLGVVTSRMGASMTVGGGGGVDAASESGENWVC